MKNTIRNFIVCNFKILKIKFLVRIMPVRIIVGAGNTKQKKWISTNIKQLNLLEEKDWGRYFPKKNIKAILAEHVWEHLSKEDGIRAARMCFKYLKPGGHVRIAVPDGLHPDINYIDYVKPLGNGPGADDHKVLYTYRTLGEIFELAGFKINFLEYFDENGRFIYNKWNLDDGMIMRSSVFDKRNKEGKLVYTSLIIDAKK